MHYRTAYIIVAILTINYIITNIRREYPGYSGSIFVETHEIIIVRIGMRDV